MDNGLFHFASHICYFNFEIERAMVCFHFVSHFFKFNSEIE